jgi:hypothetical protein
LCKDANFPVHQPMLWIDCPLTHKPLSGFHPCTKRPLEPSLLHRWCLDRQMTTWAHWNPFHIQNTDSFENLAWCLHNPQTLARGKFYSIQFPHTTPKPIILLTRVCTNLVPVSPLFLKGSSRQIRFSPEVVMLNTVILMGIYDARLIIFFFNIFSKGLWSL